MARVDELFGLTRKGDNIVSNDANADVVKIIVGNGRDISLLFGQSVAFIAASLGIEQLPAAFCSIVDRIVIARNEVIERRIERKLRAFSRR
jgi:hypothetical protein